MDVIFNQIKYLGTVTQFELADGYEMRHKPWCGIGEVPYYF